MRRLLCGKWKDENGKMYHIPAMTIDRGDEQALIKTAREAAHRIEKKVRGVWATYEHSERIL